MDNKKAWLKIELMGAKHPPFKLPNYISNHAKEKDIDNFFF